jgi:hypothetical protein
MIKEALETLKTIVPEYVEIEFDIYERTKQRLDYKDKEVKLPLITFDFNEADKHSATFEMNIYTEYFDDFVKILEHMLPYADPSLMSNTMSDGEYSLSCKSIKKGTPIFVDNKKIIHGQTFFIVTKND